MSREFILRPNPGYDIRRVVQNPNSSNASVWEYRHGILKNIYPATRAIFSMYKIKPPPEYYAEERSGHIVLDKPLPDGYFCRGVSPFVQAIVQIVHRSGVADFGQIYRGLTKDFQIMPEGRKTQRILERLLKWMTNPRGPSYLVYYKDGRAVYYKIGVPISGEPPLVEYRKGVDPIKDQICKLGEIYGTMSYGQIKDHIVGRLGWLSNESYLIATLDELVKSGNLQKVGDIYRFVRSVEKF